MPKMAKIVPLDSIYILQRLVLEFLDDLIFWVAFECFDLRTKSLELIIQPPKIDFDILLGAKSVGSRGLFAKDQNHRFNQRFSTLLLLTFDLTLCTLQ